MGDKSILHLFLNINERGPPFLLSRGALSWSEGGFTFIESLPIGCCKAERIAVRASWEGTVSLYLIACASLRVAYLEAARRAGCLCARVYPCLLCHQLSCLCAIFVIFNHVFEKCQVVLRMFHGSGKILTLL